VFAGGLHPHTLSDASFSYFNELHVAMVCHLQAAAPLLPKACRPKAASAEDSSVFFSFFSVSCVGVVVVVVAAFCIFGVLLPIALAGASGRRVRETA
jgi:hypothetical protein